MQTPNSPTLDDPAMRIIVNFLAEYEEDLAILHGLANGEEKWQTHANAAQDLIKRLSYAQSQIT